jgi:membrane protein required for colicin V production
MNGLDWVFVVLIALLGFRCMAKGFAAELLSMAAVIAGFLAGIFLYRPVGALLVGWGLAAKPAALPGILGFLAAFLAAFLAMKLIGRMVSEGVEAAELGTLDGALGFVLGLAEGLLLVCILLLAMSLLEPALKAIPGYSPLLSGSYFARVILPIIGPEAARAAQGINAPDLRLRLEPPAAGKP